MLENGDDWCPPCWAKLTGARAQEQALPGMVPGPQELLPSAKALVLKELPEHRAEVAKRLQDNGWTHDTRWDSEKYAGVAQWPSLDQRIAAARAELDKPSPKRFPHEGRSDRVYTDNQGRR